MKSSEKMIIHILCLNSENILDTKMLLVHLYFMCLDDLFSIEDRNDVSLILLFVPSGKILVALKSFIC